MKKAPLGLGAIAALLVLAIVVAWVAFGPKRTLTGVVEAIETQDIARLNELVDFPAVRSQVKAAILAELHQAAADDPYDQMGMALGMAFVDPMLDALISPEAFIAMASEGQALAEHGMGGDSERWQEQIESGRAELSFKSLSRAEVAFIDEEDPAVSLAILMDRVGLDWRIVGGRLDTGD